ncbi:MAG: redoxin domain-containing protein [Bacteroidia bacterium]
MRKFILTASFILPALFSLAQKAISFDGGNYTINGKLSGLKDGDKIYLFHKYDDKVVGDSTTVKAGKFAFKGQTPEPNLYWLQLSPKAKTILIFFIDKGKVTLDGKADSLPYVNVKSGPSQEDYVVYGNIFRNTDKKRGAIIMAYNEAQAKGDAKGMEDQRAAYEKVDEELDTALKNFIKTHPRSPVSGYAIFANFQNNPSITDLDELYKALDPEMRESKFGKVALERIDKVRGTSVGYKAIDFTQNDVNDKPVTLSGLKGKYVLVDFWASWCGPCRAENPNVVSAYNMYKDKGFDILGVSLDNAKDKWLKAIEKDNLTWTHVSDLKGWGNEVAAKYGIQSIPANLLLDKEGNIIAKNLRGEDLKAKLEELLK